MKAGALRESGEARIHETGPKWTLSAPAVPVYL